MEYQEDVVALTPPGVLRRSFPYLRSLLQLALAGALLAGLLWRVDLSSVRDELERATLWWLPLAFAAVLVSHWFRALRWQQFFQPMTRVSVSFLFGTAVLGVACNMTLPLRAGEVVRVQVLRRRTGLSVSSIVATVISEKLADTIAFCSFIILGVVLYEEARFLWPLAVLYGCLLTGWTIGARWLAGRSESAEELVSQPEGRLRAWVATELRAFGHGLQAFRRPGAMFTVFWTSHVAWLVEGVVYYACGRALGLDLSPAVYLLVVVVASLAVSVPVTQAGLGVFEIALTGLIVAFGVDKSQAAAFAIFSHVVLALPYLVAGPMAAVAMKLSLADIVFLRRAREEAVETAPA
ncbi:MAG: lysylphosphatidylglycerol synthase transmembrane domain-containing protein [Dehalococcoidia bacterium]|nr:lysylphosphatidylglycerol synthase transmembrane domain-containing protein [Dehalococcoidia bacterium]